jgi:acetoin utilization protein AcuB
MTSIPSLKAAMTPFPYSVSPTSPAADAETLMDEHNVHHLPVVENHQIIGIVTPHDIVAARNARQPDARLAVRDCYAHGAYVVELDEPLERVLMTMAERQIGSAVVTRHGRLAGVFTTVDVCRCFGQYLADNFPHDDGDAAA